MKEFSDDNDYFTSLSVLYFNGIIHMYGYKYRV